MRDGHFEQPGGEDGDPDPLRQAARALLAVPPRRRERGAWAVAVFVALAAHGVLLAALWPRSEGRIGAGGQRLDIIAVEIVSVAELEMAGGRLLASSPSAPAAASTAPAAVTTASPATSPPSPEAKHDEDGQTQGVETKAEPEQPPQPSASHATDSGLEHVGPSSASALNPPASPEPPTSSSTMLSPPTPEAAVEDAKPRPEPAPAQPKHAAAPATASAVAATASNAGEAASHAGRRASAPSAGEIRAFGAAVSKALASEMPPKAPGQGIVWVNFTVAAAGGLEQLTVARSSGKPRLDDAARTAVRRAKLPVPPAGLEPARRTFAQPLCFGMSRAACLAALR